MRDAEDWVLRKAPPLEVPKDEETSKIMEFEDTIPYPSLSTDYDFIANIIKSTEEMTLKKLADRLEGMLPNISDVLSIGRYSNGNLNVNFIIHPNGEAVYSASQTIYDFLQILKSAEEEKEEEEVLLPIRQSGFYQDDKGRLFKSDGFEWIGDAPASEFNLEFLG